MRQLRWIIILLVVLLVVILAGRPHKYKMTVGNV